VKGPVSITKDDFRPLLKVEAVKIVVAQTGDDGVGGGTPPVMTIVARISGFPEEETGFASITVCFKVSKIPLTEVGQV
jgi:hypothetical protein